VEASLRSSRHRSALGSFPGSTPTPCLEGSLSRNEYASSDVSAFFNGPEVPKICTAVRQDEWIWDVLRVSGRRSLSPGFRYNRAALLPGLRRRNLPRALRAATDVMAIESRRRRRGCGPAGHGGRFLLGVARRFGGAVLSDNGGLRVGETLPPIAAGCSCPRRWPASWPRTPRS